MKHSYDKYDLLGETDEFITRKKFSTTREKRFYPSEASVKYFDEFGELTTAGGCLRASYFRLSGDYARLPNEPRTEYIFAQGKIIEQWLIDRWKEMGIWVDNNIKFINEEYNISGELDVLLREPTDGKLYGVEVKTFYGYNAEKEILGNKSTKGAPKLSQLLQTLIYLYNFRDRLSSFRMVYFARDSVKRRTFKIELHEEDGLFYPKVDGEVMREFTINSVFARYKELQNYIDKKEVPPRDYELQYPDEKIEKRWAQGRIAKTKYEAWKKGKLKKYEYIGDWMCNYCAFKNICYGDDAIPDTVTEDDSNESDS